MNVSPEQIAAIFKTIKDRVLPVEKLKLPRNEKGFNDGFRAGYKEAYDAVMGCEREFWSRRGLAQKAAKDYGA